MKLRNKILFVCCVILIVSLLSLAIVERSLSSKFVSEVALDYTMQIIGQLNSDIETKFIFLNSLATQILYNSDIFSYLQDATTEETMRKKLDSYYAVQSHLESVRTQNPDTVAITLYRTSDNEVITTDSQPFGYSKAKPIDPDWYDKLINGDPYGVTLSFIDPNTNQIIRFGIARKIIDNNTKKPLGVVVMEAPTDSLTKLLGSYDFGPDSEIRISDNIGVCVCSSQGNPCIQYGTVLENQARIEKISRKSVLVSSNVSPRTFWIVNCFIPLQNLTKNMASMYPAFFIVGVIDIIFTFILLFYISKKLMQPLDQLVEKMQEISTGKWETKLPVSANGEIGKLIQAFNLMSDKINALITTTYKMEIQKQQTQLKMLLIQMNPHFLYNAIEVIRLKAIANEDYEVSMAMTYLGKFLRLKLNTTTQCVSVREETEHVIGYYKLSEISGFMPAKLIIDIDPTYSDKIVPKLSLQPLVENSMKHAFPLPFADGEIAIHAYEKRNCMFFSVHDNGCGMSTRKVQEIMKEIQNDSDDGKHVGLHNVARRLRLLYGEASNLKIESEKGKGTTVSFTVPYTEVKNETADCG